MPHSGEPSSIVNILLMLLISIDAIIIDVIGNHLKCCRFVESHFILQLVNLEAKPCNAF